MKKFKFKYLLMIIVMLAGLAAAYLFGYMQAFRILPKQSFNNQQDLDKVDGLAQNAAFVVTEPKVGQKVNNPLNIQGSARVFEGVFQYRLRDAGGDVLVSGNGLASMPEYSDYVPFHLSVEYPTPKGDHGLLELFAYSAKDGSEINTLSIPVRF